MKQYIYMYLILLAFISGCAATPSSVPAEKIAHMQNARSITFLADIKDQIFGTRLSGLLMKSTEDFQTDWNSNEVLGATITKNMMNVGRKVDLVHIDRIQFKGTIKFDSIDDAFSSLSRELSLANPQSDADIHLILLHVPVDSVPHPITGAKGRMIGQGVIGLMLELGSKYKQSYVVRVNNAVNAISWGKVQCIIVYALAAVDAHSHEVIQKFYPRWVDHPLPDDFWISDFKSLTPEDKNILRDSCLDGLTTAVEDDLQKMGLR